MVGDAAGNAALVPAERLLDQPSAPVGKPLPTLYREVVPFLVILGIGVLLITYVPEMSLGLVRALGRLP